MWFKFGLKVHKRVCHKSTVRQRLKRVRQLRKTVNYIKEFANENKETAKEVKQRKEFVKAKRAIYKLITIFHAATLCCQWLVGVANRLCPANKATEQNYKYTY